MEQRNGQRLAETPKRIAIVGAGLRGLASAAYLKSAGAHVRVFEKAPKIGGIWRLVHGTTQINTPSYGYTFHESNRWTEGRPNATEILANLTHMVADAGLENAIELSTTVIKIHKTQSGTWTLNNNADEFDGILVCPGHLGDRHLPDDDLVAAFDGNILLPYTFSTDMTRGRHVAIVGSGSTALDMMALVHGAGSKTVTLFIHRETQIRDVGKREMLIHAISSNPILYKLTKLPGSRPAAVRQGISEILDTPNVTIVRDAFVGGSGKSAHAANGLTVPADVIVWCTGWKPPEIEWIAGFERDPTLVVASCERCLDTAGFGFGSATAHAKALLRTLQFGLADGFASGSESCACVQRDTAFSRHIILNLAMFYLAQPGGWRLLCAELRNGLKSNWVRLRRANEPKCASLLAFMNAPFGF